MVMPDGSKRVAVILQPSYLPWLGYFDQLARSDVFVLYDDVQYDKHSWRNRNRIKTPQGAIWLTVPVLTKAQNWPTNRDVKIDNLHDWRRKHLHSIRQNYAAAEFFRDFVGVFETLYAREWRFLIDLNIESFGILTEQLGLKREIRFSSELNVEGKGTQRLVDICTKLGASRFFEGAAGRDYIDEAQFQAAGIELAYQEYDHPVYPQLHDPFVPYLSVLDLLFNCGPRSLEVLSR